jgi:hypothetical protein
MRFSTIVCAGIVAACAVGPASAQTSVELPATAGGLPLVGWSAVLMILIGTGVTVYRMLQGSPPGRPKRRVSGKALRER